MWTACKTETGYGLFLIWREAWRAHRVAWMLANRKHIPEGMHILHRCDNPACVNIDHLWLGTHAENMADMAKKGRTRNLPGRLASAKLDRKGSKNNFAKIDEATVLMIRSEREKKGSTFTELSEQFSISRSLACQIVNRQIWTHV